MMTTSEFAARLGVCPETVRRWIKAGKIAPDKTPGGQYRFTEEQIEAVLSGSSSRAEPTTPSKYDPSAYRFMQKTLARRKLVSLRSRA